MQYVEPEAEVVCFDNRYYVVVASGSTFPSPGGTGAGGTTVDDGSGSIVEEGALEEGQNIIP